ncbi:MAG: glycosyltransferase [Comamonadaceae bacterium]|nr:MAG: glycosyltransferase [Comamonadaceae bacterium]
MPQPSLVFLVPGDLATLTGGYVYDRHIVEGLRATGWGVEVVTLGEGFPHPSAALRREVAERIAAIGDGRLVVVDGLAFGALPDVAEQHARRLRWVALVHHPLALETGLDEPTKAELFASERRALAAASLVIVTSRSTGRALADYDVAAERIRVVEPGVRRTPTLAAEPVQSPAQGLSMLCVATMTARKGHLTLVEALAGLQDQAWTLHCVGSLTRDEATVRDLRAALGAHGLTERVHLHGELDGDRLAAHYAQAQLFVLPSFHEGYGMVLAEALAQGLPIVSTTAGAIPDTVPQSAGLMIAPGDVAALRAALLRLLQEPQLRATLAHGARVAGERLPTWPQAVERFDEALRSAALGALQRLLP